jgi:radical SAM protein with 4Fe4S-binding SPASM domain
MGKQGLQGKMAVQSFHKEAALLAKGGNSSAAKVKNLKKRQGHNLAPTQTIRSSQCTNETSTSTCQHSGFCQGSCKRTAKSSPGMISAKCGMAASP